MGEASNTVPDSAPEDEVAPLEAQLAPCRRSWDTLCRRGKLWWLWDLQRNPFRCGVRGPDVRVTCQFGPSMTVSDNIYDSDRAEWQS